MSYPTKTAFVYSTVGWDDTIRQHPAMKWMNDYTDLFDTHEMFNLMDEYHTTDFKYQKPTGETFTGKEAEEQLKATYAAFSKNFHEPRAVSCWETDNGWEMMGQAMLYGDLQAPGGSGQVHPDAKGKKWDIAIPSSFHFVYVKDPSAKHDGIKLAESRIFSDSAPAIVEMLKRGMLKPEQLMG